jgi:hypothetical protein
MFKWVRRLLTSWGFRKKIAPIAELQQRSAIPTSPDTPHLAVERTKPARGTRMASITPRRSPRAVSSIDLTPDNMAGRTVSRALDFDDVNDEEHGLNDEDYMSEAGLPTPCASPSLKRMAAQSLASELSRSFDSDSDTSSSDDSYQEAEFQSSSDDEMAHSIVHPSALRLRNSRQSTWNHFLRSFSQPGGSITLPHEPDESPFTLRRAMSANLNHSQHSTPPPSKKVARDQASSLAQSSTAPSVKRGFVPKSSILTINSPLLSLSTLLSQRMSHWHQLNDAQRKSLILDGLALINQDPSRFSLRQLIEFTKLSLRCSRDVKFKKMIQSISMAGDKETCLKEATLINLEGIFHYVKRIKNSLNSAEISEFTELYLDCTKKSDAINSQHFVTKNGITLQAILNDPTAYTPQQVNGFIAHVVRETTRAIRKISKEFTAIDRAKTKFEKELEQSRNKNAVFSILYLILKRFEQYRSATKDFSFHYILNPFREFLNEKGVNSLLNKKNFNTLERENTLLERADTIMARYYGTLQQLDKFNKAEKKCLQHFNRQPTLVISAETQKELDLRIGLSFDLHNYSNNLATTRSLQTDRETLGETPLPPLPLAPQGDLPRVMLYAVSKPEEAANFLTQKNQDMMIALEEQQDALQEAAEANSQEQQETPEKLPQIVISPSNSSRSVFFRHIGPQQEDSTFYVLNDIYLTPRVEDSPPTPTDSTDARASLRR